MKEGQFGFEYTWADLQPIRILAVVAFAFQIVGALIGLWIEHYSEWFSNLWAGGALASFPGFVAGYIVQAIRAPSGISENKTMVRRFGVIACLLSLCVFVMPLE